MKHQSFVNNPLIVALDVDDDQVALRLARDLSEVAGAFKLGPRLIHRYGQNLCSEIAKYAPLFVDCKFFDIPSTMEAAVRASFAAGASLVTVHALAGAEALQRLATVETELNQVRPFKILAVTVLTSWSQQNLPANLKDMPIDMHVKALADLAKVSGLTGIVCSPQELDLIRDEKLFTVTPGIRFDLQDQGDQKRTMSPADAIKKGASALVVGRPIVEAKNPMEAAMDFSLAIVRGS